LIGCSGSKPPPTLSVKPSSPLSVQLYNVSARVFSAEDEVPNTLAFFHGGTGSVRVTLEIDGSVSSSKSSPISVNDVLFKAAGDGSIALTIKRPSVDHPKGLLTITCLSGTEESSAEFEPELWFEKPGAIVTFEPVGGENSVPISEGTEVILGRYVARNLPQDIRLTLKAMFSKKPVPPRTNAGLKSVP
jgi:hypothetical protein